MNLFRHGDRPRRDWLLDVVRLLLSVMMVLSLAACLAAIIALPLMTVWWEPARLALEERASRPLPDNLTYLVAGCLVLGAIASILAFRFFAVGRRIVDTVTQGDPFIPENAVRLREMGWLAVITQLLAFPASWLTGWLAHVTHSLYFDGRFSLGAILLALVLFVLARIFRIGAEMREDLDGTV